MKYDDFQILDENSYAIMREQFSVSQYYDRHDCLKKIIANLDTAKNLCFGVIRTSNAKIQNVIKEVELTIRKNIENLTATFNLKQAKNVEIHEFNIFSLLKIILETQKLLIIWQTNEDKEYYKIISKNMQNELINMNYKLISALEKSNFKLFKYM